MLLDLTLMMIQQWISEYVDNDHFILSSVVELIELLLCSAKFWAAFKSLPCTAKLLGLSKRPAISAFIKSKIITIVSQISKGSHSVLRPDSKTKSHYDRNEIEQDLSKHYKIP